MSDYVKVRKDALLKLAEEIKLKAEVDGDVRFSDLWIIVRDNITPSSATYGNLNASGIIPQQKNESIMYEIRPDEYSDVRLYSLLTNFGDATVNDVRSGKTFTSKDGLLITGKAIIDDTVIPAPTLTSISASYTGGSVLVGTKVTDIGIKVVATYSDRSTNEVHGWTSSGTVTNGTNSYTISYEGKTATVSITGYTVTNNASTYTPTNGNWTPDPNSSSNKTYYSWCDIDIPTDWTEGTVYSITFDGRVYSSTVRKYTTEDGIIRYCLGNLYIEQWRETSTYEPFCIVYSPNDNEGQWLDATRTSHTIEIKKVSSGSGGSSGGTGSGGSSGGTGSGGTGSGGSSGGTDEDPEFTRPSATTPPITTTFPNTFSATMKTDAVGGFAFYTGGKPGSVKVTIGSDVVNVNLTSLSSDTYSKMCGAKYATGTSSKYKVYIFPNDCGIMGNVVNASGGAHVKKQSIKIEGTCAARTKTNPSPKSGFVYANGTKFYRNGAHYPLKSINARLNNIYKLKPTDSGYYVGSAGELRQDTFKELSELGLNSVKLVFGPAMYYNGTSTMFSEIDKILGWANTYNMTIQLNMHNLVDNGVYNIENATFLSESGTQLRQNVVNIWKQIADHYKNDSRIIGFGLLNEPIVPFASSNMSGAMQWWYSDLMQKIVDAIRSVDTNHVIFIDRVLTIGSWTDSHNADPWKVTCGNYFQFPLVDDHNMAIEWHDYDPLYFSTASTPSTSYSAAFRENVSKYPNGIFATYGSWDNGYHANVDTTTVNGSTYFLTNAKFQRWFMKEKSSKAELMYGKYMVPIFIGEWGGTGVQRFSNSETNNAWTTFVKDKVSAMNANGYYGSYHLWLGRVSGYINLDPPGTGWGSSHKRQYVATAFRDSFK